MGYPNILFVTTNIIQHVLRSSKDPPTRVLLPSAAIPSATGIQKTMQAHLIYLMMTPECLTILKQLPDAVMYQHTTIIVEI